MDDENLHSLLLDVLSSYLSILKATEKVHKILEVLEVFIAVDSKLISKRALVK